MTGFKTTLKQFAQQGEKTGWTYILIPSVIATKVKPGNKKTFRVKGKIDDHTIKSVALMPMGNGDFIMAVNAGMRKAIRKNKGASVIVEIEVDNKPIPLSAELLSCLKEEPACMDFFKNLPGSHQHYYSNWIESAKTDTTKTKRIAMVLNAFSNKLTFAQMMKLHRKNL